MKNALRALAWLSLGGAIIAVILYFAVPLYLGTAVKPIQVTRGEILQTVVASGRAETPSRLDIGSQIIGTASRVFVEQGARVNKGDILITLDDSQRHAAVDQAEAAVQQAKINLDQITALTLPTAQQKLIGTLATKRNAETQLARAKGLAQRSIATIESVENMQRAYDIASAEVRAAELSVKSASKGGSGYETALASLAQAEAALRVAQAQLLVTTIYAPVSGVVIARNIEEGAIVEAGKALLVLAPERSKQLVVQIDERNLNLIRVDQPAIASADAYPDQTFKAVILSISPAIDADRGSVEVKLSVANPPDYLKEDMTVSVDIEVARRQNALLLPNEAIRNAASTSPYVLAIVDGHAVERPVTLGARGTSQVEVIKGIAVEDLIIPVSAATVKAGQKVRIAKAKVPK